MDDRIDSLKLFIGAFGTSSFAGLAALLRSGKPLSILAVFSAMLNSGLLGLTLSLIAFQYFQGNPFLLLGLCILAGLGGMTAIDFIIQVVKQGGVEIHVHHDKDADK